MRRSHDELLRALFDAGLGAVSAEVCVPPHLPPPPRGRTILFALGKAAAAMAKAVTDRQSVAAGLVVTRYGHALGADELPARIEVIEAGHPVPDAAGLRAAERAMALVVNLREDDRLLALISGGGSSLLPSLPADMTLADEQQVTRALLNSGAAIGEINAVRRCLSRIKGGRLAALASPAEVVTLVLSDVPGDDPALVASGPTIAGRGGLTQAREVLRRYEIAVPDRSQPRSQMQRTRRLWTQTMRA